jgi:hypothetical protein
MEATLILKNEYYKNCNFSNDLFEMYFDWCYCGNSNNTWYYVYKGDRAYYSQDTEELYLNKDEYFERVILKDNDFIQYCKKYYNSIFERYI